ncbi:MAG: carboxylating nicotinate-nucleotide diphosphorylase [Thermaerobacterales bacterium]
MAQPAGRAITAIGRGWGRYLDQIVDSALAEDLGWGDATAAALIDPAQIGAGVLRSRSDGVLAGLPVAERVFLRLDDTIRFRADLPDGTRIQAGDILARVEGPAQSMLSAERVALNFLQRLSGIATLTGRFVAAAGSSRARIVDTRKTTPGLRRLEKYAVRCGGGHNHRFNLSDAVLIKDNHLQTLATTGFDLGDAVKRARSALSHVMHITVEIDRLEQLEAVIAAGADAVLLDNMPPDQMAEAVRRVGGRLTVEASGGVTLDTIAAIAATGVDLISVGALTHSAPALDIGLDFARG